MAERRGNLFAQLTRLFRSTPIVKRKIKSLDTRVARADPTGMSSVLLLSKTQGVGFNASLNGQYGVQERQARLQDYNEMDAYALVNAALDIYADESVAQDANGKTLHIHSDNPAIKENLEELFYNTLNVEFNLRPWTRNLCKYGDFYLYIDVSPDYGVINVIPVPVNDLAREEGYDPQDPLAVRFRWTSLGNRVLENWEVAHFRLLGNDTFLPYGSSMVDGARRSWRQLVMVEDAMLVYRITRAVDRRVFYVDVGGVSPDEIGNYMEAAKMNIKSQGVVDRNTGKVDQRYAPLSIEEDYWIATRGGETGTKIDTLPAGQNAAHVEDVEYIKKQLIAALKVPAAYLGYNDAIPGSSGLAQVDIRFSRTVNMIQRTIVSELNKIAMVHLYSAGFRGEDLMDYELSLSNPSTIAQQQKLELLRTRFEIAGTMPMMGESSLMSERWLFRNVVGLNDQEILQVRRERLDDMRAKGALEAAGALSGAGGEEGGEAPDAGGDAGAPAPDAGGDAGGPELETAADDNRGQGDVITAVGGDGPRLREDDAPVKISPHLKKAQYNRRRNLRRRGDGFATINDRALSGETAKPSTPKLKEAFEDVYENILEETMHGLPLDNKNENRIVVAPTFGMVELRMLHALAAHKGMTAPENEQWGDKTPGRLLAEHFTPRQVIVEADSPDEFELYDDEEGDAEPTT